MFADLQDCIEEAAVVLEVMRALPATVNKGRVTGPAVEQKIRIQASVQSTGSTDLQFLPEGMRNQDAVKLFTETELFTVQRAQSRVPDRFEYRGVSYQVELVDDWHDLGNYFRVIAVRLNR